MQADNAHSWGKHFTTCHWGSHMYSWILYAAYGQLQDLSSNLDPVKSSALEVKQPLSSMRGVAIAPRYR